MAVNPHESDLRTLRGEDLAQWERAAGSKLVDTEPALVRAVGEGYEGPSLALIAAIMAVFGLLAEAGLSRRFFV